METEKTFNKKECPQGRAMFFSRLYYWWTLPLFKTGYRRDLTEDDLYETLKSQKSHMLGNKLEEAWMMQVKLGNKSLARSYWSVFKKEIYFYLVFNLVFCFGSRIFQPLLLTRVLSYYVPNQTHISLTEAYICTVGIIFFAWLASLAQHTYVMGMRLLGIKFRVSVSSLIYRKTLKLSRYAMNETSSGQIITLLSNDCRLFELIMAELFFMFIAPTELIIDSILLYLFLGNTALVGVGFLLVFIPFQMYTGKLAAAFRMKTALKTDRRILLMNEIISGVQVIKMYAWEKPFAALVEIARRLEVKQIRGAAFVNGVMHSYNTYMSRTGQFLSILTFVLTGHSPVAHYVFVLTSIYNNLARYLSVKFPDAMSTFAQALVSCKRIEKFLVLEEVCSGHNMNGFERKLSKSLMIRKESNSNVFGVCLSNVSAKWNKKNVMEVLSNIDLRVGSKEKIAVVGRVGCGKTTLLNVILEELPVSEGILKVNGTVSYSSQEPWLFKSSIRQNILFGEVMDSKKYKEVIQVCALEKDLTTFPYGDLSIVGEKGIMLSGGQKARINLARAIYKDADIYLLDDPLSAVDSHVGKHLFEKCVCDYLSNKCTILVTHQLQHLQSMDCIYVLEEGKVSISGTYQELQKSNVDFTELLTNYHDNEETEDNNNESSRKNSIVAEEVDDKISDPNDVKEHMITGSMSNNIYKQYFTSGGSWYFYLPVAGLLILSQIIASSSDYFLSFWVNIEQLRMGQNETSLQSFSGNHTNVTSSNVIERAIFGWSYYDLQYLFTTNLCICIYSGLILLVVLVAATRSVAFLQYCLSSATILHNKMFYKLIRAPMRFFHTNPSGRILNRFAKDVGSLDEVLPSCMLDSLDIIIMVLGVTIVLCAVNPWMLIPTILLMSLMYTYKYFYIKTSTSVKRIEGIARSPIYSHMGASLQGLSTIRAFKAEQILSHEFDSHQDHHTSAQYMFFICNRAFGMMIDLNCIIYIGVVTLSTFVTATLGGNVGLVITQALGLTGRLQVGIRKWSETENQMTSVERVVEYCEIVSEEDTDKTPYPEWPKDGKVQFQSVYLRYAIGDAPILKNLNFVVEPKQKIGIVGRTGAGKSSIIAALFRLAPTEGSVLVDDVDTKTLSLQSARSRISIIPQEPFLFFGTLRKNLDPFDEYDDDILWNALQEVELKSVIKESPHGLNSNVFEGGSNFSVGQRQLICLARAITRNNKILVLDEATANVDPKTDELIQATIRRKFVDCTVLTVAHRLHTVIDSDKILVMDNGCVIEYDHPHVLLQNINGLFYSLVMNTGKHMADNLITAAKENFKEIEDVYI